MEAIKEKLKRSFLEALTASKKVKLSLIFRPKGIKFDEDRAMVRLDLDTYNGFSIGDFCTIERQILRYTDDFVPALFSDSGVISCFVELTGHLKGGRGIKIKDMFCVLAVKSMRTEKNTKDDYRIMKTYTALTDTTQIHLFSVGGLKKVEEK